MVVGSHTLTQREAEGVLLQRGWTSRGLALVHVLKLRAWRAYRQALTPLGVRAFAHRPLVGCGWRLALFGCSLVAFLTSRPVTPPCLPVG